MSVASAEIVSRSPQAPSTELGRFRPAGGIDVDRAVESARRAQPRWAALPAPSRGEALRRAADAIEARAGELALLACREVGKPIVEARGEVARTVAIFRYYAGACLEADGETYPAADGRSLLLARRVPRGLVGIITPWNFPLAIPAWKLAPALAYGNACVWKPSSFAPACAKALVDAVAPALPEPVLELVLGHGDAGAALVGHSGVRAVSFTGSEATGLQVAERLAARGAAAQCEMGGQNASVVLADADVASAARTIAGAAMGYAGQKCTATSRVIVERRALAELREALRAAVEELWVEEPESERCQVGPLISGEARGAAVEAVERALARGGRLVTGAVVCECDGYYLAPTVVELEDPDAELAQEEVFAPVCALLAADDADDAVRIANGVRFGLSTALFTRDLDRALLLGARLESGLVRVNQPTSGVDFHAPFGGEKASGLGPREQGRAAREFYTQTRTLLLTPEAG